MTADTNDGVGVFIENADIAEFENVAATGNTETGIEAVNIKQLTLSDLDLTSNGFGNLIESVTSLIYMPSTGNSVDVVTFQAGTIDHMRDGVAQETIQRQEVLSVVASGGGRRRFHAFLSGVDL